MDKSFTYFEELIESLFNPKIDFNPRKIDNWSSMQTLIVVSAIDEHYDILVSYHELKSVKTIEDLHKLLLVKISE